MNEPHLRPFYMHREISLDEVAAKFNPRLSPDHPTNCVIASDSGRAFGYMQWYLIRSFPEWAELIDRGAGVSIDYYIRDPDFLGRGLGSRMLMALVHHTTDLLGAGDRIFHIGHDNQNVRTIRCTRRAGFDEDGAFVEKGRSSIRFIRDERP